MRSVVKSVLERSTRVVAGVPAMAQAGVEVTLLDSRFEPLLIDTRACLLYRGCTPPQPDNDVKVKEIDGWHDFDFDTSISS
jgi:hypothetical protein